MLDGFARSITYLRISITDRCNYRCRYCMPDGGIEKCAHEDICSLEGLRDMAAAAVRCGVKKIRVTGGEPLVRRGAVDFCRMLSEIPGVEELCVTTNGSLLKEFARPLRDAGVTHLNISLDTLNEERFRAITRLGTLQDTLDGIEAAERAGFAKIKLNCVLLGGVKRIGQVTEKLVPLMAVIYIVCALIVVFANISAVPGVFASIFKGAFNPAAVTGGAAGMSIKLAMTKGVGRGVFSNEAGLGSAPIAHAATSEKNPVKQGLYGIFEVFMDTIVICTLTSLVVLCSGAADGNYGNAAAAGVSTTVVGFSSVFGAKAGSVILAVGLLLFATSTILGWALYGTRCAEFLFGSKIIRPYQIIFCLVVVAGAVADLTLVWDISDTLNGLMSIPNLIALLLLSPVVIKVTKEHFAGLRR